MLVTDYYHILLQEWYTILLIYSPLFCNKFNIICEFRKAF